MSTNPAADLPDLSASIPQWTIGDRLRKLRTTHGYTQGDFATIIGATKSAIAQWETDRTRPRDLRAVAIRIELATGVPAWWTLGLNEENRHPDNPNGGSFPTVHPPGLEPGTHWLTVDQPNVIHLTSNDTDSPVRDETADVIAFPALKNGPEVDAK